MTFDNTLDNVRKLLIRYPETRGSDILLILRYWAKYTRDEPLRTFFKNLCYLYEAKKIRSELTNPESITRCRRKIQEDGSFLPSEKILQERKEAEKEIRHWAGIQ